MKLLQREQTTWLSYLIPNLRKFLEHQMDSDENGYFSYSYSGDIFTGRENCNLAGAVFALKLFAILDEKNPEVIQPIVERVLSFEQSDGTFCDSFIARARLPRTILSGLKRMDFSDLGNRGYIRAETRQTYSALLLYGIAPKRVWLGVPVKPDQIRRNLAHLDWSRPWGAGSHFSHFMFFLSFLKKTGHLSEPEYFDARDAAISFVTSLQHASDGAWYIGNPSHRQKVNGAMKVISGLAVDGLPFAYPERLIDLCLAYDEYGTDNDACDEINQIFVLRQSVRLLNHSYPQDDVKKFCLRALENWRKYYYPELGGFSFYRGRAANRYYGAKVSRGLDEPDIHGTLMFVWGLSMIQHILRIEGMGQLAEIKS